MLGTGADTNGVPPVGTSYHFKELPVEEVAEKKPVRKPTPPPPPVEEDEDDSIGWMNEED